jgi:hypothetical protein
VTHWYQLNNSSARQVELSKAYYHYSNVMDPVPGQSIHSEQLSNRFTGLERAQFMLGFLHLYHPEVVPVEDRGAKVHYFF